MTMSQICDHFEQRELSRENTWRSHATKKIYKAYLSRWVRPHWHKYRLAEVRTIQVGSWLRTLPLAKSSCAKIRNLMSVLFNHACRYEFFDRNPIYLVRQSAKRRTAPSRLLPAEIKALINNLKVRERTLSFLLRPRVLCCSGGNAAFTRSPMTGFLQATVTVAGGRFGGQAILRKYIRPAAQKVGIQNPFGWHTFRHTYSTLLRSVGTEFKVMQELLRHSSLRSTLDVYTQATTPAKHAAHAAVVSLVLSSDKNGGSPSIG